ncbi:hypothetical protein PMZ80_005696, partial [Knufia obscura]
PGDRVLNSRVYFNRISQLLNRPPTVTMDSDEKNFITPSTTAILTHDRLQEADISTTALSDAPAVAVPQDAHLKLEPTSPAQGTVKSETIVQTTEHTNSSSSSFDTDLEKQEEQPQPRPGWYSFLRYTALNTYRRLFSLVFIGNVIAFIIIMVRNAQLLDLVNAAAINLCICGLARSPFVINTLFVTAGKIPRSTPIRLRTLAAKVFHFGGVHSGCGVASAIWYIAFVGKVTYDYTHGDIPQDSVNVAVVVLAYLIMVLLCAIIVAAYPAIRFRYHDYFEAVHRFSGWAVILLFWALLLTFSSYQQPSMGIFLVNQPAFWIIIILTAAVIQPWAMLRRVKVQPQVLSTHATRLHFDFTRTKFGQGISIARHPLKDWHSFASFPDKFDHPETNFSLVVSKAGDFTGDIIANSPKYIWKRSVPAYGFGYVMKLYSRMILVTTGSGIGPCLSYLGDDNRPKMRVLWQTRSPVKTYGQGIIDLVHHMDENPVILDTTQQGNRKDMLPHVIKLYKEFKAEAVCIISNPKTTNHLVYELSRRGILAMGPIFDS